MSDIYMHSQYLVRKKVLTMVGHVFHIYDPNNQVIMYAKQKAFKLKEDIRLFTGEDMQTELLNIKARKVLDISATYDVVDSAANVKVGALRRKGLKSILRDEWIIMDANDIDIGSIKEDSTALALVRRFLTNLIPQKFHCEIGGMNVCDFKQNFNPFVVKVNVDFSKNTSGILDKRLGLAAAVLLCAIEGKQN